MADFVAVIRKAVDNLSENSPQNRAKVYDKARAAIRRQLEAINPRPSDEVIARQIDKLDLAIEEVESEHVEALPAEEQEADRLMSELEALVGQEADGAGHARAENMIGAAEPAAPEIPAGPVAGSEAPLPPVGEPVARPDEPAPFEAAPYEPAPYEPAGMPEETGVPADADAEPYRPPFLSDDEHDDAFGLNGDARADTDHVARPAVERARRERRSGSMAWVLIAALLLLVAGGAYAAWTQRDALTAMFGLGSSTPEVAETTPEPEAQAPAETEAPAEETSTETAALQEPAEDEPETAETPGEDGKFTQRLGPDGVETNPGPAPETADAGPIEGRSVAELSEAAQSAGGASDPNASGAASSGTAGEGEAAAAGEAEPAAPIGVSQKMFLYEERLDQQSPTVTQGSVVWTLAEDDDGAGPNDVAIRGEINSGGENGLSALITIKRNTDQSLPASHIIELVFALPPDFAGGSIDQVQRIAMKQTEQDQGDPLIAVPAQITPDFYMIALNDLDEAVAENTRLLKERNWIDIPVVYGNGRRALMTLEKGATGVEVFNEAFDIWARR